ncbi:MAG: FAD-dependent oxidoreductase [Desulfobacterales bacterium]|nr:FAD-dependent oxidoreductase [Desulfobacterales bacterium]
MKKRLLLLGGGHAHLETIAAIHTLKKRGHEILVVSPSRYHYYSGMGPGMLGGTYTPEEIRFDVASMVSRQGATFIEEKAKSIDASKREVVLQSGESLSYDVLSINVGSCVADGIPQAKEAQIFPVKPIEKMLRLKETLTRKTRQKCLSIAIAGGGPSSAEVAGNIIQLVDRIGGHQPDITIYSQARFLSRFSESIKIRVKEILENKGVHIVEKDAMVRIEPDAVVLKSGCNFPADIVVSATGVRPSPVIEKSDLPTGPDHGLRVNRYLQCSDHPEIFGGGDCIYFEKRPLSKTGVYAVRQNRPLLHNLTASLEEKPLNAFHPGTPYLLVFNLGSGIGYFKKNGFTFDGKLAFQIKNYIDRRFMKRYQKLQ